MRTGGVASRSPMSLKPLRKVARGDGPGDSARWARSPRSRAPRPAACASRKDSSPLECEGKLPRQRIVVDSRGADGHWEPSIGEGGGKLLERSVISSTIPPAVREWSTAIGGVAYD